MHLFAVGRAAVLFACCSVLPAVGAELAATIVQLKPSVVGVGTALPTRSPAIVFNGTGFVVGDGLSVITNAHVVAEPLNTEKLETLGIVIGNGVSVSFREAKVVAVDRAHDLAHLRLVGTPLPALSLAAQAPVEGADLAFTGYPLGMVLGLHPVTHRATLSAVTPIVLPSLSARRLDARAIGALQGAAFDIFQLDGTAYPGNSGSPVYEPATGAVVGVINMVLVKGLKETAITHPSGISYAVPVRYVRDLMQQKSP